MASDYEGLKKIGLSYIRNASRNTWTDFGEHDPGVTMLEQLCFALVDLGYRTSFDLKDIMADMPRGESLVSPESVLSCSPVTIDDYRKLILEHFRGKVRNVHLSRKDTSLSFDKSLARTTGVESVDVAGEYGKSTVSLFIHIISAWGSVVFFYPFLTRYFVARAKHVKEIGATTRALFLGTVPTTDTLRVTPRGCTPTRSRRRPESTWISQVQAYLRSTPG